MQAKSFSKMSAIELADIQIPGEPLRILRTRECLIDRADRDLNSGYDPMGGIEEFGPAGRLYHQESVSPLPLAVHTSHAQVVLVAPTLRTRLAQRPKANGAPTLIFIAGAALRVADVTRILKDKKLRGDKGGEVAKLFAKHIKLEEHVTFLRRTKLSAAAGTPGRLGKLLEAGNWNVLIEGKNTD